MGHQALSVLLLTHERQISRQLAGTTLPSLTSLQSSQLDLMPLLSSMYIPSLKNTTYVHYPNRSYYKPRGSETGSPKYMNTYFGSNPKSGLFSLILTVVYCNSTSPYYCLTLITNALSYLNSYYKRIDRLI